MKNRIFVYTFISLLFFLFIYIISSRHDPGRSKNTNPDNGLTRLKFDWDEFSGGKYGKVIYANPPDLIILDLQSGKRKRVTGIKVEGGRGRWNRGKTPRPFWSHDGTFFVYRYQGNVFVASENGEKKIIDNPQMDRSKETRWSIINLDGSNFVFGPSLDKKAIAVSINDPGILKVIFSFSPIDKHCELTSDGRYIVYNNGSHIFSADLNAKNAGIRLSFGQNCRPCASPSRYAAWLPAPHLKYNIHMVADGKLVKQLNAPEGEEIYRLNWSNNEEFAVHMYGSRGNTRMNIRKISSGDSLFIGNGWDPDLWIGGDQ